MLLWAVMAPTRNLLASLARLEFLVLKELEKVMESRKHSSSLCFYDCRALLNRHALLLLTSTE
jgi:hypothetical protein